MRHARVQLTGFYAQFSQTTKHLSRAQFSCLLVAMLIIGNRFGRMATYSGQVVKWDEAMKSDTDLGPQRYSWDAEVPIKPGAAGLYACAMPGKTKPY